MKQRITLEQLEQLTTEKLDFLSKWYKPEVGDIIFDSVYGETGVIVDVDVYDDCRVMHITWISGKLAGMTSDFSAGHHTYPILSVGQMIELLELFLPTLHIDKHLKLGLMTADRYEVFQQGLGPHSSDNLCDALFESLKATRWEIYDRDHTRRSLEK